MAVFSWRSFSMPCLPKLPLLLTRISRANRLPSPALLQSFAVQQLATSAHDKSRGALPRFFVDELPRSEGLTVPVQGDEFWHMFKVLRLGIDDRVELFDGKGGIVEGLVVRLGRSSVDIAAAEAIRSISPIGPHWHVAAACGNNSTERFSVRGG